MKKEDKDFVKGYLRFIIIFLLIVCTFIGLYLKNDVMVYIGVISGIIGLIVAIGSAIVAVEMANEENEQRARKMAELKEELKQYASFSREHDFSKYTSYETLSIKKQTSQFADSFTIEKVMLTPMSYNPEKYIFTSATVGGITTGGIDKVGGNYVSGKKVDSGKCELKYFGQKIQRIQLTDKLYKEAKKSAIKKYLNDKKQIVVENETDGSAVISAQLFGIHSLTTQEMLHKGYPSREKCKEIIAWICETE